MRKKEFCNTEHHTTASSIRLVKPWFGIGRIVTRDSWFGSVKTALTMQKRRDPFRGECHDIA